MKSGKKKSEYHDTRIDGPDSDSVGSDTRNNPNGIDALRILQVAAVAVCLVLFIWFILRNLLHII